MDKQNTMVSSKTPSVSAPAVLIISDDKFNDLEFFYPYYRLSEAGYRVDIASPAGEEIKGDHSFAIKANKRVTDVKVGDYALLYLPGLSTIPPTDVIRGKRLAAWPEVEEEITKAGGTFVNAPLVEDGQFITSRWPGDLPSHLEATLKALGKGASRKAA